MTDKQQPEALRIADELEEPMTDFPQPTKLEAEAAAELRRLHAELETLRAKLKTYEDLGDAGSDVQLLRMGYAAARLEIESLRDEVKEYRHAAGVQNTLIETLLAEKPAGAQQPGGAYAAAAAILEVIAQEPPINGSHLAQARVLMVAGRLRASHWQAPAQAAAQQPRQIEECYGDCPTNPATCPNPCNFGGRATRAPHGQAPAQASPAAVAGSSDDLVTRESAMQAIEHLAISNSPGREDDAIAMLYATPTTQPPPQQAVQEPAYPSLPPADEVVHPRTSEPYALWGLIKLMDYAKAYHAVNAPQPSPAAQGDALDTMRLDWLSADESKCVFHLGNSWYTRPSYGMPYRKRASLREAIDAARAAQEGK